MKTSGNKPEFYQASPDYALYRPVAKVSVEGATELILQAVAFAREHKVRRLLIDGTQLSGYESLTVLERLNGSEQLADEAHGVMKIAIVTKPERIDFQRFGIVVAANRGLHVYVFTSAKEAEAWLAGSPSRWRTPVGST
jgi:hypothetical protein